MEMGGRGRREQEYRMRVKIGLRGKCTRACQNSFICPQVPVKRHSSHIQKMLWNENTVPYVHHTLTASADVIQIVIITSNEENTLNLSQNYVKNSVEWNNDTIRNETKSRCLIIKMKWSISSEKTKAIAASNISEIEMRYVWKRKIHSIIAPLLRAPFCFQMIEWYLQLHDRTFFPTFTLTVVCRCVLIL